jgi:hypothetical protein
MITLKKRQRMERQVVRAAIDAALAAGYTLAVFDGEEVHPKSRDRKAIFAEMFATDDEYLMVYGAADGQRLGWMRFIYGNDGWDVLADYTVNLEPLMPAVNELTDKLEASCG